MLRHKVEKSFFPSCYEIFMHSNCSKTRNWPGASKASEAAGAQANEQKGVEEKSEYHCLVLAACFKVRTDPLPQSNH